MPSKLNPLTWSRTPLRLVVVGACLWAGVPNGATAEPAPAKPAREEPAEPAPAPPEEAQASCRLLTEEAPRGGRVEVKADQVGQTPLVLIGGHVARILLRKQDLISAQIPRDSDGGMVTVKVDGRQAPCGTLTIIGKN